MNTPKIAITCGDPAGVGQEIIQKWWNDNPHKRLHTLLIGPKIWLESLGEVPFSLPVGPSDFVSSAGAPSVLGAQVALEAIALAAQLCANRKASAVVTAPINKEWMLKAGFPFPGHTEYFAQAWGGQPIMAFLGKKMRVTLATWHIPLSKLFEALTPKRLAYTIEQTFLFLQRLNIPNPRVAVCGLNPHAGERGLLGNEEANWINPLLKKLKHNFPGLYPEALPSDTLFYRHLKGDCDAVVALYHDQGLIPIKTVEFETTAQTTLGLEHIRTSPAHGTGFDIAGHNKASTKSLANAYELAESLLGNPLLVG